MKICHYLKDVRLELGGVVRAVLDIAGPLAAAGHDVTLITTDDTDASWDQQGPHPKVLRVGPASKPGRRLPKTELARMRDVIADADVLHLHGVWVASNMQVAKLAREVGTPYVYAAHGMLDDWCMSQKRLKKQLYLATGGRRTMEQAAFVVCSAEDEARQVAPWIPNGHTKVILPIMDLEPFADLPGESHAHEAFPDVDWTKPTLLFLSRLNYKKGVDRLLDAAARLRDDGLEFQVLIAGTGEDEQPLRQQASRLNLDEFAHFLGFVSGTTKVSLYQASDLFVLPTSQENFGFVIFEALAAGTGVVTTKGVDPWPELQSSGGAVITDAAPDTLARTLTDLLADRARIDDMGAKGRAWVLEHLAMDRVVSEFVKAYQEAAAKS